MMRDDYQNDVDPSEALRRRVVNQVAGESADPTAPADTSAAPASPVDPAPFDAAPAAQPPADGGYTQPAPAPIAPEQQGVTDPNVQSASPAPAPYQPPAAPNPADNPYPSNPASGFESLPAAVAQIYRTALGRDGSVQDIQAWISGTGGNLAAIQQGIYGSPEAQSYSQYNTAHPPQTPTTPSGPGGGPPTNGNLTDPNFAAQFVAWWGSQPGVNPSVKNDPGYWIGRFTSGAFGNDQNYAIARMKQAEGPPEGAMAGGASATSGVATRSGAPQTSFYTPQSIIPSGGLPQTNQMSVAGLQAPQGLWNSDFIAQLRQALMQRLSADSAPVDPNDANIASPLSAAKDQLSRNSDTERNALAERLYAQGGLNTDAVNQGIQQSSERTGTALSSLRANLIVSELKSRRDDLASAMQLAVQAGDSESAQNIQLQLSALNAQIQREGIGANLAIAGQQFNQNASNAVTG